MFYQPHFCSFYNVFAIKTLVNTFKTSIVIKWFVNPLLQCRTIFPHSRLGQFWKQNTNLYCKEVFTHNKIEGSPILRLAMVKRQKIKTSSKNFGEKVRRKNSSKKLVEKIEKNSSKKYHGYTYRGYTYHGYTYHGYTYHGYTYAPK